MQRLQRIDQHTGDVAAAVENAQGRLVHVAQRVGLAFVRRIADPRLHVAPPSVVGAAESNQVAAAGVVSGEAYRLHHGLGSGHVKGHLVHAGYLEQPPHIVGDRRMVAAEHRAQVAHPLAAAGDALLVEVVAEDIHAVGARHVVELVAVQIGQRHAGGGRHERTAPEMPAHEAAELIGHAVTAGELQVGDALDDLRGQRGVLRASRGESRRQAHEARPPCFGDARGRLVDAKNPVISVLVVGDEAREAARHARMSRHRTVFGARKLQPKPKLGQRQGQRTRRRNPNDRRLSHLKPPRGLYFRRMTLT